jgi:hypothetical protein
VSAAEIIAHHAAALLVLTEYPLARLYGWEPPAEDEWAARLISREPPRAVPTSSARLRSVPSVSKPSTSLKHRPTRAQVNAFVAAYAALVAEGITPRKFRALVRAHGVSNIWNAELTLRRRGAWRGKEPT